MSVKTATIIGVTGLVGSHLYSLLKEDKDIDMVRLIVRRPMPKGDSRTEIKLVDFNDPESLMLAIDGSDVLFCAIGTTNKKVKGDKQAYRKVDVDIPAKAARFCKMTGCETFVLVSAIGANHNSRNFYLKIKGEAEEAVRQAGLRSVHIMRPSMLLGDRKESRPGEKIGKAFMTATSFLWPSRYRPILAEDVAKAIIATAKKADEGYFVYEHRQMLELSH